MKKLSVIVAMALAVVANYSCGEYDNSVSNSGTTTTITDENGKPYEVSNVLELEATAGQEVKVGIKVYPNGTATSDYYVLKSGTNMVQAKVNDQTVTMLDPITVADDGKIELLGNNDIETIAIQGATPKNLDCTKLAKVKTIEISLVNVASIELPKLENLENLAIAGCALQSIDLGENYELKFLNLSLNNLKTLNLKNFYKLETVLLAMNGNLSNIEFSNSYENLTVFEAPYCALTSFDTAKMRHLKTLDLSNNKLEGVINLAYSPTYDQVKLENNNLTSVYVGDVTKLLNISNNKLTFATMPLPSAIKGEYIYAPQQEVDPIFDENGILDLSAQYIINNVETAYETNINETDVDNLPYGRFAFVNNIENGQYTMTNTEFPALTLKTKVFNTGASNNQIYNAETQANAVPTVFGGTIKHVWTKTGTAEDNINFLSYFDEYKTRNFYYTLLVNGTRESVAQKNYNYFLVNLDEPLMKGNVIKFTGFRNTASSEHSSLYLLFDLLNNNEKRLGKDYKPGMDYTFEYNMPGMHANIWYNDLVPDVLSVTVDEAIAGSKSFKIALNESVTPTYLTKIEILRRDK